MSNFIKLTPHMDKMCNKHMSNKDRCCPINIIKGPETMFNYSNSKTVACMVNMDKISRVYVGMVDSEHADYGWSSPFRAYSHARNFRSMLHTIIELDNGTMFSVIEKPEYVTYLLAGRSPRNWPTNAARYWTLSSVVTEDEEVSEKSISEFKPISDLIKNGLE